MVKWSGLFSEFLPQTFWSTWNPLGQVKSLVYYFCKRFWVQVLEQNLGLVSFPEFLCLPYWSHLHSFVTTKFWIILDVAPVQYTQKPKVLNKAREITGILRWGTLKSENRRSVIRFLDWKNIAFLTNESLWSFTCSPAKFIDSLKKPHSIE